jgi:hypothetical protein
MATASLREPDALAPAGGEGITAPPIILDPCVVCGVNPKAANGRLSRCISCIKAAAAEDRAARAAAEAALAEKRAESIKACRTCKRTKALADFSPHRLSKDGRRHDCRACVALGRTKRRKPLTEAQRQADRAARQSPHRKATNLESVIAWQTRNPAAVRAARLLDADIRHGKVSRATVCEAERCEATGRLCGHHNAYNRRRVAWLCPGCHRRVHSGIPLRLKDSAALRVARAPQTG